MRVIFNLEKEQGSNTIKYPDNKELFSNSVVSDDGTKIIATYKGSMVLDEYTYPLVIDPITKLEFMELFTDTELESIFTTAKTDAKVEVFVEKFKASETILLSDQRLIDSLNYIESLGLLLNGRVNEIVGV